MQKVSVITMTYNDRIHLEKCAEKVLKQNYDNLEYIVVDGGSTDGTPEFLAQLKEKHGDRVIWVSEPDKGLYDALNKGIRMASGDIVGLMCDEFADEGVVSRMVSTIEKEKTDGVHGNINYMSGDKVIRRWRMGRGTIRTGWMPGHPTLYLKKEIYEAYGLYKTDYKIAADYEFMIRILKDKKVKLSYMDEVLVHMFHGEESTRTGGFGNYVRSLKEGHRALKENHVAFAWSVDVCRIIRVLIQFVKKRG